MTNQQGVEWRDYLDAKFATVEQIGHRLDDRLRRIEDRFVVVEDTVGEMQATVEAVDKQLVSHRMRLENLESRIPLLTAQEGRLIAKIVSMTTAVIGTLWGAWWAVTHWAVVMSVSVGLLPKR